MISSPHPPIVRILAAVFVAALFPAPPVFALRPTQEKGGLDEIGAALVPRQASNLPVGLEEKFRIDLNGQQLENGPIAMTVNHPGGAGPHPVAVVMHGMAMSKTSPLIEIVSGMFLKRGFIVIRPDFRNNRMPPRDSNESEGNVQDYSIAVQTADAIAALSYAQQIPTADCTRIVLAGYSGGGFVARHLAASLSRRSVDPPNGEHFPEDEAILLRELQPKFEHLFSEIQAGRLVVRGVLDLAGPAAPWSVAVGFVLRDLYGDSVPMLSGDQWREAIRRMAGWIGRGRYVSHNSASIIDRQRDWFSGWGPGSAVSADDLHQLQTAGISVLHVVGTKDQSVLTPRKFTDGEDFGDLDLAAGAFVTGPTGEQILVGSWNEEFYDALGRDNVVFVDGLNHHSASLGTERFTRQALEDPGFLETLQSAVDRIGRSAGLEEIAQQMIRRQVQAVWTSRIPEIDLPNIRIDVRQVNSGNRTVPRYEIVLQSDSIESWEHLIYGDERGQVRQDWKATEPVGTGVLLNSISGQVRKALSEAGHPNLQLLFDVQPPAVMGNKTFRQRRKEHLQRIVRDAIGEIRNNRTPTPISIYAVSEDTSIIRGMVESSNRDPTLHICYARLASREGEEPMHRVLIRDPRSYLEQFPTRKRLTVKPVRWRNESEKKWSLDNRLMLVMVEAADGMQFTGVIYENNSPGQTLDDLNSQSEVPVYVVRSWYDTAHRQLKLSLGVIAETASPQTRQAPQPASESQASTPSSSSAEDRAQQFVTQLQERRTDLYDANYNVAVGRISGVIAALSEGGTSPDDINKMLKAVVAFLRNNRSYPSASQLFNHLHSLVVTARLNARQVTQLLAFAQQNQQQSPAEGDFLARHVASKTSSAGLEEGEEKEYQVGAVEGLGTVYIRGRERGSAPNNGTLTGTVYLDDASIGEISVGFKNSIFKMHWIQVGSSRTDNTSPPSYRGRGIGTLVMRWLLQEAQRRSIHKARWFVTNPRILQILHENKLIENGRIAEIDPSGVSRDLLDLDWPVEFEGGLSWAPLDQFYEDKKVREMRENEKSVFWLLEGDIAPSATGLEESDGSFADWIEDVSYFFDSLQVRISSDGGNFSLEQLIADTLNDFPEATRGGFSQQNAWDFLSEKNRILVKSALPWSHRIFYVLAQFVRNEKPLHQDDLINAVKQSASESDMEDEEDEGLPGGELPGIVLRDMEILLDRAAVILGLEISKTGMEEFEEDLRTFDTTAGNA